MVKAFIILIWNKVVLDPSKKPILFDIKRQRTNYLALQYNMPNHQILHT